MAVAALKRVQGNLERYRASLLKTACEGGLVPTEAELARAEGRDTSTPTGSWSASCPSAVHAGVQQKRGRKYKEPAAPDTSDLPDLAGGLGMGIISRGRRSTPGAAAVTQKGAGTPYAALSPCGQCDLGWARPI